MRTGRPRMNIRRYVRMALWMSAVPIVAAVAAQGPTQKPDPLDEPFKGVTTNGTVMPGLFPIRSTGVSTAPVRERRGRLPRVAVARAAGEDGLPGRRQRVAQVEQRPPLRAAGRQLQGDDRGAARTGVRAARRGPQREGAREVAQHHAAERNHRRDDQEVRGIRRGPLQPHRDGRAVRHARRGAGSSTAIT